MDSVASPVAPPESARDFARSANAAPPAAFQPSSAEDAPPTRRRDPPFKLQVRLDSEAQRFVQTLTNPITEEEIRSYPSEVQLAFSRAVMAYLRAQAGS
jgi:hypothetical protein